MQASPSRPGSVVRGCRGRFAAPSRWSAVVRRWKRSTRPGPVSRRRQPTKWRTPEERAPEAGPDPFRHSPGLDGTKDRGSPHSVSRHPPGPRGSAARGAVTRMAGRPATLPPVVGLRQNATGHGTNPPACPRAARTRSDSSAYCRVTALTDPRTGIACPRATARLARTCPLRRRASAPAPGSGDLCEATSSMRGVCHRVPPSTRSPPS